MLDVRSVHAAAIPLMAPAPVAPASVVKPSAFADLAYAPALLLPVQLDASVIAHTDFAGGCEAGFEGYFEDLLTTDDSGECFYADCFYTLAEVYHLVQDNLLSFLDTRFGSVVPLSWCAGYTLGWLSALALSQPSEARAGLLVLEQGARAALHVRDVYLPARRRA